MQIAVDIFLCAVAVTIAAFVFPGIKIKGIATGFVVVLMLALVMPSIEPLLTILTLPINAGSVAFLSFILQGLFIVMIASLVPGFNVDSFGWAMLLNISLSLLRMLAYMIFG